MTQARLDGIPTLEHGNESNLVTRKCKQAKDDNEFLNEAETQAFIQQAFYNGKSI